jgi:hypothetical protein
MIDMLGPIAYFSPETMLPLSSMIATVVGCALLIKRSSIRFVVHCCRAAIRKRSAAPQAGTPHFGLRARRTRVRDRS